MTYWLPERLNETEFLLRSNEAGCVGIPGRYAMMGGVTSGAVIAAMEEVTGSSLIWSSTQFVSPALAETDFHIQIQLLSEGRRITQARGELFDGERLVLVTHGSLGAMDVSEAEQFENVGSYSEPLDCPTKQEAGFDEHGGLFGQFERRLASQSDHKGREALWFRPLTTPIPSASLFAVIGDFLAGAVTRTRGASSLDNNLRIHALEPSEWYMAESQIQSLSGRVFQGQMKIFTSDRKLVATASQSGITPKLTD